MSKVVSLLKSVRIRVYRSCPAMAATLRARYDALARRSNMMGGSHRCYICGGTFRRFYPYRGGSAAVSPFIRALDTVGSDVDRFSCPICESFDRERHLLMYFDNLGYWHLVSARAVLHIAPERNVASRIVAHNPSVYVKADLFPKSEDIQQLDVTALPFQDSCFDLAICNHVLEHVRDDEIALAELFRVVKSGGCAILQTPYSSLLADSFVDRNVDTDELRRKFYGQEDHVRVYGQDLFTKIQAAGFTLDLKQHKHVLKSCDGWHWGVNPNEDLILVRKS